MTIISNRTRVKIREHVVGRFRITSERNYVVFHDDSMMLA